MAYTFDHLPSVSENQRSLFHSQGFLVVERLLDGAQIDALRERFPRLFAGKFDTGIYPDEWYWREGMSLPDVTRHMANAWKADLTVAKLALSESVGRFAAELSGWDGARLGRIRSGGRRPDQADRASSGYVVHGFHRSAVDGDLLGDARRDAS